MLSGIILKLLLVQLCASQPVMATNGETTNILPITLGHDLLDQEFLLNYTNFNHGSFGACPKFVLDYQNSLRLQQEQQPDPWFRQRFRQMINDTRADIAEYAHVSNPDSLVLVESASTAVNSILRSMNWNEGDIILMFSVAYNMVKYTAQWLHEQYNVEVVQMDIAFPISDEIGVDAFLIPLQEKLAKLQGENKLGRVKVAIFDHIVSIPAIRLPVHDLATITKRLVPTCFVLIDGAHAIGQLPSLNLQELGPIDAYLSNGHKWLYSAKGSAFLWVNASRTSDVFPEPTVISSENCIATKTSFPERYSYTSTRDYTALLTMSKALEFRKHHLGGEEKIYQYVRALAQSARQHLIQEWNVVAMAPDSMEEFMVNIALPTQNTTVANELQQHLLDRHGTYIVVAQEPSSGIVYTRLSAQVYLELSDFVTLSKLVLAFIQENDFSVKRID